MREITGECALLGFDRRGWRVYRRDTDTGHVLFRLRDGSDFLEYQEHDRGVLVEPILWTVATADEIRRRFFRKPFALHIHASRVYGEPKLKKPAELKGIPCTFSVPFFKTTCQCFVKDGGLWMRHKDFFSPCWQPPPGERLGEPQNYYLAKYFGFMRSNKFLYANNYAGIVLRNEVWLRFDNLLPLVRDKSMPVFALAMYESIAQAIDADVTELGVEWTQLAENVYNRTVQLLAKRRSAGHPYRTACRLAGRLFAWFFFTEERKAG